LIFKPVKHPVPRRPSHPSKGEFFRQNSPFEAVVERGARGM
jgi:hypothetical protein